MDRHEIWRIVHNNLEGLKEAAPEGYAPVVKVFLAGRPEPIALAQVETTREAAFPWTLLVSEGDSDDATPRDREYVFVREEYVQRIEISFVPSEGRRVGFAYRELDDASATSSSE